jgi:hypothetical protein
VASEKQKALLLKNLIRLLDRANAATNRADDAMLVAAATIGRIVRGLPEGLLREQAWKAAQPQVLEALSVLSNVVGAEILNELGRMTPEQAQWAAGYLNGRQELSYVPPWAEGQQGSSLSVAPFSSDAPGQAAANRATYGFNSGYLPRTTELATGLPPTFKPSDLWGAGRSADQLTQMPIRVPNWVYKIVKDSRITGFTVQQFFGDSAVLREDLDMGRFVRGQGLGGVAKTQIVNSITGRTETVPRFAKFSYTSIDRNIRSGFLSGLTNEEIARNIIFDEVRGKMRLGTNAVRLKSDARAAARTLLADMSERVHQAQWKEMSTWEWEEEDGTKHSGKIIQGWRWDASMDSRACETCSIKDGTVVEERSQLPAIPLHVNCRCRVLPITETARILAAEDKAAGVTRSGVEFVADIPPKQKGEPQAAYVRRMHDLGYATTKSGSPSGERWYRKRVETKADNVPDWMGELARRNNQADQLSLQEQFGGNAAGAQRAEYFRRQVAKGVAPQDALVGITRKIGDSNLRTWVPVATLRQRMPEIKAAQPILSPRQVKELGRVSSSSPVVKRLEKQLAEAKQQAAIDGDTLAVEQLAERLQAAQAAARSKPQLSRIPRPRRGY